MPSFLRHRTSALASSSGFWYGPSKSSCGGSTKSGFTGIQLLKYETGRSGFSEMPQIPVQSTYMMRSVFQLRPSPRTSIDPPSGSPGVKIQSFPIDTRFVIVTSPTFTLKSASVWHAEPVFLIHHSAPSLSEAAPPSECRCAPALTAQPDLSGGPLQESC